MSLSRDTFYRYQELAQEGGVDALISRSKRTPNVKNRVDPTRQRFLIIPRSSLHTDNSAPAMNCARQASLYLPAVFAPSG